MAAAIFYVLNSDALAAQLQQAATLIENYYEAGRRVYVHVADEAAAFAMDDYLWTFQAASFVPHNLYGEGLTPPPRVQIGFAVDPKHHHDVLVNLTHAIPPFFARFACIIELLTHTEPSLSSGRERYRHYQKTGHIIEYHDLRKAVTL